MKTLQPVLTLVVAGLAVMVQPVPGFGGQNANASAKSVEVTGHDGQHDFDFEIGDMEDSPPASDASPDWINYLG